MTRAIRIRRTGVAGLLAGLCLACAGPLPGRDAVRGHEKAAIGGLAGAVAGGLLGSTLGDGAGATAVGAVVGGLLGGGIGAVLDEQDRERARHAAYRGLEATPSGETRAWTNPDTGARGSFTPLNTYQGPDGRYCRDFRQEIRAGGERERDGGSACRLSDGSWRITS